jgi:uncharacterized protein with HEPN domain
MNRSDLDRLRDAREFARHAQDSAGTFRAAALAQARLPQHAALYNLIIIGETLHRVSAAIKTSAPAIGWRNFSNLRNYIVHSYWQVDLEIVADVIRNRLDALIGELDRLIPFVEHLEK